MHEIFNIILNSMKARNKNIMDHIGEIYKIKRRKKVNRKIKI